MCFDKQNNVCSRQLVTYLNIMCVYAILFLFLTLFIKTPQLFPQQGGDPVQRVLQRHGQSAAGAWPAGQQPGQLCFVRDRLLLVAGLGERERVRLCRGQGARGRARQPEQGESEAE